MKFLLVLVALIGAAAAQARSGGNDANAQVLRSEFNNDGLGNFGYALETDNGISAQAQGSFAQGQREEEGVQTIQGSYSFTYDGVTYTVNYIANENGYQATGDHLPQPPQALGGRSPAPAASFNRPASRPFRG